MLTARVWLPAVYLGPFDGGFDVDALLDICQVALSLDGAVASDENYYCW